MLVQDPNTSHVNPYARTGSQIFKILTPKKPPNDSNTSLWRCRMPTLQMQILTIVQVPNNSNNYLPQGRLPMLQMQILTLVQIPETLHAHPYTCTGSQKLRQFLMLPQAPDNYKHFLHD
ncbi:hypothetical protein O181_041712 [Austropuccinia psidii MF-1]|uniref:Uncharacterized protein n=1 Tax=Austropuccinia psidii MF-1 TaxID=1389203 RepID=A0A9Q3DH86_9BASI|nr:hypothetical protein [Austropuccinia psidii MF-1]